MLSIIVCSRYKHLDTNFTTNIENSVGVVYEVIHIDNSTGVLSISQAYNKGCILSKYKYLCFVHEDVIFHTKNWGLKLIEHLSNLSTGIIGIGGCTYLPQIPTPWSTLKEMGINIIQSDKTGRKQTERSYYPSDYQNSQLEAIMLDGVLLCMRKELFNLIKFDESIPGFHGYDYDICIQSIIKGYRNYIVYDIVLEHFSRGKTNQEYFRNLIYIFKKWEKQLPLYSSDFGSTTSQVSQKNKAHQLNQLKKKMVRKGFSIREMKSTMDYYQPQLNSTYCRLLFSIQISTYRLFMAPKYLFGRCEGSAQTH